MDINYHNRSGSFYPTEDPFVPNLENCPEYWKNESNKVEIKEAELKADFYHTMGAVAYSAGMVSGLTNFLVLTIIG